MAIKVVTLNVEGDKHIHRFVPTLRRLNPHVVCFQELFEADCPRIARELGMSEYRYVPTMIVDKTNTYGFTPKGNWGIGIMTKLEIKKTEIFQYGDFSELKIFKKPNDDVRSLLVMEVSTGEDTFRIANTHFTWTPGGEASDVQRADFERLKPLLQQYDELLFCGDLNAPRGREIFSKFSQFLHDNVPPEVTTTIDPILHYAGHKNLQLVVDAMFSTPQYRVSNVQILRGISDHMGVYGEVERAAS